MNNSIPSGVITGKDVQKIFKLAKEKKFAIPAVNVIGSNSINAVLETASKLKSPVIIQFSNGGAQFNAGKGLVNNNQSSAIAGAISGAKHVHELAKLYNATVILHTDHCAKKLLPWIDGLINASEVNFKEYNKPLFSSHMIDLSEEPIKDNIETYAYVINISNNKLKIYIPSLDIEHGFNAISHKLINSNTLEYDEKYLIINNTKINLFDKITIKLTPLVFEEKFNKKFNITILDPVIELF